MKSSRHLPIELTSTLARDLIQQGDGEAGFDELPAPATRRGRGRPAGSRTKGGDMREGRARECHVVPALAERLRMVALDAIAARMPIAFRLLDDRVLDRIEKDLEREIMKALQAEGGTK